ncbi:hypothetical protein J6590_002228 [Homalodisca vitripennis]|nr:hypothetical protein J6590_002228 [Homalodisca vitripennis]
MKTDLWEVRFTQLKRINMAVLLARKYTVRKESEDEEDGVCGELKTRTGIVRAAFPAKISGDTASHWTLLC